MVGLFSRIGKYGLDILKEVKVYDGPNGSKEENAEEAGTEKAAPKYIEDDFLFDKTHVCPSCDHKFGERTVRTGKARLIGTDPDLRPRYEQLDVGKYDVVSCPKCGYTALSRYFGMLASSQSKLIKESISKFFVPQPERPNVYSYDLAFERYQLSLVNAVIKRAKDSEKAYICLKTAWLLRGMAENLDNTQADYEREYEEIKEQEQEYLQSAYKGFLSARTAEGYPMCGMDESTLDYLLSSMAISLKQFDVAAKLIGAILTSSSANNRIKDKARDLKEIVLKELKNGR